MNCLRFAVFQLVLCLSSVCQLQAADLRVLMLGDEGLHQPGQRFAQLAPVLADRGIRLTYTAEVAELSAEKLKQYDALLLYANIDRIEPAQEKALLDYVQKGGGFVPIHCATYCFRNSEAVVALMGAQFKAHGTGVFRTENARPTHAIMQGFGGFESWDETYVHHLHNEKNRTVLEYRVDQNGREPWTWVRTQGAGRVFYTAWGHDQRTWGNAGFQNLIERGIRWAAKDDLAAMPSYLTDQAFPIPEMTSISSEVKPFKYVEAARKVPNYPAGKKWGAQDEDFSTMQAPLPPEESLRHLVVPAGFRVELFAAEPDLCGKPICMVWDERGRLWVAETYDYPNELQPEGQGRDRIRICEDTDGDLKADKFTVFAEKLSIPTSIAFHRGGVIVQDGTSTLYLKDTDGDDVADERRTMFTGWSQSDTHGGVSNFQYGLDNWIWAMQGYNDSRPAAGEKKLQAFRNGFFRFRPDGSEVEFLRSTNNNTWGLGLSEEGLVFGSTANGNPSVYMPIANRYYERVRGWAPSLVLGKTADTHLFKPITEKVRQVDQHGGYTAAAGHALYTARNYPQQYWNRTAFVNGPTGHLVGTFVLRRQGSDFRSTNPFNLLASDDEWTAPIMSEVGPDGNVWVIDWYNYIVQHNPTPVGFETGKGRAYETELRDKKHGRIYRVVYEGSAAKKKGAIAGFSLAGATPSDLVAALKQPTMLWRKHAQRLLVERGKLDVLAELLELTSDQSVDEIGLNVGVIHALWTLHGLGALDGSNRESLEVAYQTMRHKSAGVRRNAIMVLPRTKESAAELLSSGALGDSDAQVRLAAMLALADLPPTEAAGPAIVKAMTRPDNAGDRWIPDAAISAAANNVESYLAALASSAKSPSKQLAESVRIVAEHYARGAPTETIAKLIHQLGGAEPAIAGAIVGGLVDGWPAKAKLAMTEALETDLQKLLDRTAYNQRGLLVKLARDWGSAKFEKYAAAISAALLAELDDQSLSVEKRSVAARRLIEFRLGDREPIEALLARITPQAPPELAAGIVDALALSESSALGELVVGQIVGFTPQTRKAAIAVLLSRPRSTVVLLAAIDEDTLQLGELLLDQKQALASHPDKEVQQQAREILERGGAIPNADRQAVLDKYLPIAAQSGDAVVGQKVFKDQCSKCHRLNGEGQTIGPDLTGMAVHPKAELLAHILDPNRSVEGNFRVYTVVTTDGLVINGLLASESKTVLELFDAEGKKQIVLREEIEELVASAKSLMPEGFEKQIPPAAMGDLLELLTQRGEYQPVDMSEIATITSAKGMFYSKNADVERLLFEDWSPKHFQGVPFKLTDPQGGNTENIVLLHGPPGAVSAKMPKSVVVTCGQSLRAIHLLSGVSGWGFPSNQSPTVSMIVRLHYVDGATEDHELKNGIHFADYIARHDVPKSEFAFKLRDQQVRYLSVIPERSNLIEQIELVKGPDRSAPVVMAITLETLTGESH